MAGMKICMDDFLSLSKWIHSLVIILLFCSLPACQASTECSRAYMTRHLNWDIPEEVGVFQSYNYPFNYRDAMSCSYYFYVDHLYPKRNKIICFTFHRFVLEDPYDSMMVHFKDYSSGYGPGRVTYSGTGELTGHDPGIANPPLSVWQDFCWSVPASMYLLIEFKSDKTVNKPGFWATYKLSQRGSMASQASYETAPCSNDQWTCYNRECIGEDQTCNGVDDCGDYSDETYTHARCGTGVYGPSIKACDFQNGDSNTCNLEGIGHGWNREYGNIDPHRGPSFDHTFGYRADGAYARAEFSSHSLNAVQLAEYSIQLEPFRPHCLSFWYHMQGKDVGALHLYSSLGGSLTYKRPLWSRTGNFSDRWLHAEFPFESGDTTDFVLEAERSSDPYAHISVDDISIQEGTCTGEDISSLFELDLGGYRTPARMNEPSWRRMFKNDATYKTGYIMQATDRGATLISPPVTLQHNTLDWCLTMWYAFYGPNGYGMLDISLVLSDNSSHPLPQEEWLTTQDRKWHFQKININGFSYQPFEILLTTSLVQVTMEIDDIALYPGICSEISFGSCHQGDFRCDDGECIDAHLLCDGTPSCRDGSDEIIHYCCPLGKCHEFEFCCRNGNCIIGDWVCDGDNDCKDWSDEAHCYDAEVGCDSDQHFCAEEMMCINSHKYVCNNVQDCLDGSDEANCNGLQVPPAALAGIILVSLVIFIIVTVKIAVYAKTRDCYMRPWPCRRNSDASTAASEPESPDNLPIYQCPPTYQESANNPMYFVQRVDAGKDELDLPPAYDNVIKGNFVQLQVPSQSELNRLRGEMAIRGHADLGIPGAMDGSMSPMPVSSLTGGASNIEPGSQFPEQSVSSINVIVQENEETSYSPEHSPTHMSLPTIEETEVGQADVTQHSNDTYPDEGASQGYSNHAFEGMITESAVDHHAFVSTITERPVDVRRNVGAVNCAFEDDVLYEGQGQAGQSTDGAIGDVYLPDSSPSTLRRRISSNEDISEA